jgi:signal transduction histidine kinase
MHNNRSRIIPFGFCIFTLSLILSATTTGAQHVDADHVNIDSLRPVWYTPIPGLADSLRLEAGLYLQSLYRDYNIDSAFIICREMEAIGKANNNQTWVNNANIRLSSLYYDQGMVDSAIIVNRYSMRNTAENDVLYSRALGQMATFYLSMNQLDSAYEACQYALHLIKKYKNDGSMGTIHTILGDIYKQQGDYIKALECYQDALIKGTNRRKISAAVSIGSILIKLGLPEESKALFKDTYRYLQQIDQPRVIIRSNAEILEIAPNLDEVKKLVDIGQGLADSFNLQRPLIELYLAAGKVYLDSLQMDQATYYLNRTLTLTNKFQEEKMEMEALLYLSKIDCLQHRYKKSLQSCRKIQKHIEKNKEINQILLLYDLMSQDFEALKQPDSALYYIKKKYTIEQAFNNQALIKQSVSAYLKSKSQQQQSELEAKKTYAENLAAAAQARLHLNYWIFGLIILFLTAAVIFYYYYYRLKNHLAAALALSNANLQSERLELKASNNKLALFTSVVSHDVLSNLDLILSTGNVIVADSTQLAPLKQYYQKTQETSRQLKQYCIDLLQETNQPIAHNEVYDPMSSIQELLKRFEPTLREKGFTINLQELPSSPIPPVQVIHIFQNFISNTIRYASGHAAPYIHIGGNTDHHGNKIWLFTDNGPGILAEQWAAIQAGKVASNKGQGVGISQIIASLKPYNAYLTMEQPQAGGARFIITFL